MALEDDTLRTPIESTNATHTALYLEYVNDLHTIEVIGTTVIPETPSLLASLLPLLVLAVALSLTLSRIRQPRTYDT